MRACAAYVEYSCLQILPRAPQNDCLARSRVTTLCFAAPRRLSCGKAYGKARLAARGGHGAWSACPASPEGCWSLDLAFSRVMPDTSNDAAIAAALAAGGAAEQAAPKRKRNNAPRDRTKEKKRRRVGMPQVRQRARGGQALLQEALRRLCVFVGPAGGAKGCTQVSLSRD